jgi:hypothetical protein
VSDIKPLTDTPFESALARLIYAGEALGLALTLEQSLEDDRAAIKADAIRRVMKRDGTAATVAERVVETDADYFAHREKQRASIVARFRADAEYWAAKAQATQASLITPDVFALSGEINELTISVLNANDRVNEYAGTVNLLKAENARRQEEIGEVVDANRSLLRARNEVQAANTDLVQANRDLAEQLAIAANEMAAVLQSRADHVPANVEAIP